MTTTGVRARTGLEVLQGGGGPDLRGAKLGLVAHPASVTADLEHAVDALGRGGFRLASLFGPQHGVRGEKQDNMVESPSFTDPASGLPVHSLYADVRKPTPAMLAGLDALLFDLQDVGVRIYTFTWTMVLAMEACGQAGVRFVVLDRPNPVGGRLREGTLLEAGFESFVGLHPLPLRHGLTLGEIARVAAGRWGVRCDLEVVPCEGWRRDQWLDEAGLPWVMPSPNLPTLDSCAVYPGTVLLEGTNLSEGRGTTRPFELVGAPFLEPQRFVDGLRRFGLPGVRFRPCWFEPTFQKHAGVPCGGAQLHVADRLAFRPVETALAILRVAADLAPQAFAWRPPPYEYETVKPPIDILWGSDRLRRAIDAGASPKEILADAPAAIGAFESGIRDLLLYD